MQSTRAPLDTLLNSDALKPNAVEAGKSLAQQGIERNEEFSRVYEQERRQTPVERGAPGAREDRVSRQEPRQAKQDNRVESQQATSGKSGGKGLPDRADTSAASHSAAKAQRGQGAAKAQVENKSPAEATEQADEANASQPVADSAVADATEASASESGWQSLRHELQQLISQLESALQQVSGAEDAGEAGKESTELAQLLKDLKQLLNDFEGQLSAALESASESGEDEASLALVSDQLQNELQQFVSQLGQQLENAARQLTGIEPEQLLRGVTLQQLAGQGGIPGQQQAIPGQAQQFAPGQLQQLTPGQLHQLMAGQLVQPNAGQLQQPTSGQAQLAESFGNVLNTVTELDAELSDKVKGQDLLALTKGVQNLAKAGASLLSGAIEAAGAAGRSAALASRADAEPGINPLGRLTQAAPTALPKRADGTTAYINQPLNDARWGQAVAQRINWLVNQGMKSAELHLNPRELGPVDVRISISNDQAHVSFNSHHSSVRDALDQSVNRLRDMLEANCLELGNVDVSDHSADQADREATGQFGGRGVSTEEGDVEQETVQVVESQGLVDYYA